jgi:hypothetical protein
MPYPIPKIAQMLQELEKFAYATSLDLNMALSRSMHRRACALERAWHSFRP